MSYEPMKPEEMLAIRTRLGLTRSAFGAVIGYHQKSQNTVYQLMKDYESGAKDIPPWIATAVRVADVGGIADFISGYRGKDDVAEFARQLSNNLRGFR